MINRLINLLIRTVQDVRINFSSLFFALVHLKKNKFSDLFFFRRNIEVKQISPFRNFFLWYKSANVVWLQLPQFGNINVGFNLLDKFQMSICEEFVKYKIYNLNKINFIPDISIDCGSYRGYFTFLINDKYSNCKKICIEPHSENYRNLVNTLQVNKIVNFETINKALSKSPDQISLELWGSNMALNEFKRDKSIFVDVETISLFDILRELDLNKKLILKVDIEGSELDFFPDCISMLPQCCGVFLETHDGWNSLNDIKNCFEKFGFQFSLLRERDLNIDSFAVRTI